MKGRPARPLTRLQQDACPLFAPCMLRRPHPRGRPSAAFALEVTPCTSCAGADERAGTRRARATRAARCSPSAPWHPACSPTLRGAPSFVHKYRVWFTLLFAALVGCAVPGEPEADWPASAGASDQLICRGLVDHFVGLAESSTPGAASD